MDSHLVYEVFLLHLGTMDQNWVELVAMPNLPRYHICVDVHFAMVFLCKLPLQLRAAARKSRKRGSCDMSSLVAPSQEQENSCTI